MIRTTLLGLLLMSSGCQLMPVGSHPSKTITVDRERLPVGSPMVTLSESPDHTRWTVRARQDYRRVTESIATRPAVVRRYRWWPLAPLSGLLQCPIGLLAAPFTDRDGIQTLRQVGCMRLIGLEPLQGTAVRSQYSDRTEKTMVESSPAPGLTITYIPDHHPEETLWMTTDRDGIAVVMNHALDTTMTQVIAGTLEVRDGTHSLLTRQITLAPTPGTTLPSAPTRRRDSSEPLLVQIHPFKTPSDTIIPGIHIEIVAALTRAGISVLADGDDYQLVVEEIRLQYQRASDTSVVQLGQLLTPTILIDGVAEETGSGYQVTARMHRVPTGDYRAVVLHGSAKLIALELVKVLQASR